jgi:hypothetical protein
MLVGPVIWGTKRNEHIDQTNCDTKGYCDQKARGKVCQYSYARSGKPLRMLRKNRVANAGDYGALAFSKGRCRPNLEGNRQISKASVCSPSDMATLPVLKMNLELADREK